MKEEITVKINLEGVEEFKRELKIILAELESIVELRNRALRPQWITRAREFFFGRKIVIHNERGEVETIAHYRSGLSELIHGVEFKGFKK